MKKHYKTKIILEEISRNCMQLICKCILIINFVDKYPLYIPLLYYNMYNKYIIIKV